MGIDMMDERGVQLSDVITPAGQRATFIYEYDFSDGWQYAIKLEETHAAVPKTTYPRCTDGERACPPENVGGIGDYEDFLKAIADLDHERHEELTKWIGKYDPEMFFRADINQDLRKIF